MTITFAKIFGVRGGLLIGLLMVCPSLFAALELRGLLGAEERAAVALFDRETGGSAWVWIGGEYRGYELESVNAASESCVLVKDGTRLTLRLAASQIRMAFVGAPEFGAALFEALQSGNIMRLREMVCWTGVSERNRTALEKVFSTLAATAVSFRVEEVGKEDGTVKFSAAGAIGNSKINVPVTHLLVVRLPRGLVPFPIGFQNGQWQVGLSLSNPNEPNGN